LRDVAWGVGDEDEILFFPKIIIVELRAVAETRTTNQFFEYLS
jgi:hypothetical protein